jgi:hypothetical protein
MSLLRKTQLHREAPFEAIEVQDQVPDIASDANSEGGQRKNLVEPLQKPLQWTKTKGLDFRPGPVNCFIIYGAERGT